MLNGKCRKTNRDLSQKLRLISARRSRQRLSSLLPELLAFVRHLIANLCVCAWREINDRNCVTSIRKKIHLLIGIVAPFINAQIKSIKVQMWFIHF